MFYTSCYGCITIVAHSIALTLSYSNCWSRTKPTSPLRTHPHTIQGGIDTRVHGLICQCSRASLWPVFGDLFSARTKLFYYIQMHTWLADPSLQPLELFDRYVGLGRRESVTQVEWVYMLWWLDRCVQHEALP